MTQEQGLPAPPRIVFALPDRAMPEAISDVASATAASFDPHFAAQALDAVRALLDRSSPEGHNHSGLIEVRGRVAHAKVYGASGDWAREIAGLAHAAHAHMSPIPAIAATGAIDLGWDAPPRFVLFEPARGRCVPRRAGPASAPIYEAVGRFARRLHAIRASKPPVPFRFETNQMFDLAPIMVAAVLSASDWRSLEIEVDRRLRSHGDFGDRLVHNDLGTGSNIFADERDLRALAAVVDFEFAHFGYRTLDRLWVEADAPDCAQAFEAGYGETDAHLRNVRSLFLALSNLLAEAGYQFMRPFGVRSQVNREREVEQASRRIVGAHGVEALRRAIDAMET